MFQVHCIEERLEKHIPVLTLEDLKGIDLPKGTIAYVPRDRRYKCQGQNLVVIDQSERTFIMKQ